MMRAIIALILVIAAMLFVGLSFGDYAIGWNDLTLVLVGDADASPQASLVIWTVRMPRLLVALLVGLALGAAGAISQAVLRNPLADPGLLGINSGASLATMIVLVGLDGVPATLLPLAGFAGAALMAAAIFALSWRGGTSSIRILLIGIGLSSVAGGATTFLSAFGDVKDVQRAMIWMTGSVYDSNWTKVVTLLAWTTAPLALTWLAAHHLDAIGLGDGTARSLGQRVNLTRSLLDSALHDSVGRGRCGCRPDRLCRAGRATSGAQAGRADAPAARSRHRPDRRRACHGRGPRRPCRHRAGAASRRSHDRPAGRPVLRLADVGAAECLSTTTPAAVFARRVSRSPTASPGSSTG